MARSRAKAPPPSQRRKRLDRTWLDVALLLAAVAAAYSHTLNVPFYLDDYSSILENPAIQHWQGVGALWRFAPLRVLVHWTFALNYRLGGLDPRGYHLVNILIHTLAGLALYGFSRGALRAPRLVDAGSPSVRRWLPVTAALIFVLHPLQTQAVTYIVQRLASLVAMFYFAALAAYVQARLAPDRRDRALWSSLCAVSMALAFVSKENSATLPAALVLVEAALFAPSRRRLLATAAGAVGVMAAFAALVVWANASAPSLHALDSLSRETPDLSRGRYLATQMRVLLHYLVLAIAPAGLHLDYAFTPSRGFLSADVLFAAAVHVALIGLAIGLWRRRPMVAFGLLFYYLAHAIESSVIPIRDVIFEHRTYLPSLGLCLAAAWGLLVELPRIPGLGRLSRLLIAVTLTALAVITWKRNREWQDPVELTRSNVALAPAKARVWGSYGRTLLQANRPAEGIRALEEAVRIRRREGDPGAGPDVANLIWALRETGRYDEALAVVGESRREAFPNDALARIDYNEARVYADQGRWAKAESTYRHALVLAPGNPASLSGLAYSVHASGRRAEAESLFLEVLRLNPNDVSTQVDLWQVRAQRLLERGASWRRAGRIDSARVAFTNAQSALAEAERLRPGDPTIRANARLVAALLDTLARESGRRTAE